MPVVFAGTQAYGDGRGELILHLQKSCAKPMLQFSVLFPPVFVFVVGYEGHSIPSLQTGFPPHAYEGLCKQNPLNTHKIFLPKLLNKPLKAEPAAKVQRRDSKSGTTVLSTPISLSYLLIRWC